MGKARPAVLMTIALVVGAVRGFAVHSFHQRARNKGVTAALNTRPSSVIRNSVAVSQEEPTAAKKIPLSVSSRTKIIVDDHEFVKPDPDQRRYRAIELANGLQCLLVSAPESDSEGGAVHVKAGHMDDPDHRPGLAHFHEHMLFLGTEKYPDENEYDGFLSKHGGSSNAYTDMEDTNYYFSLTPFADGEAGAVGSGTSEALEGSLDRLAQFFIAPTFDPSMVEREMQAIDSEYRNSLTNDSWRNFQLLKSCANSKHPFTKFGCGNYETLTKGVLPTTRNLTDVTDSAPLPLEDLHTFWSQHYQTYNLRLAVVGKAGLDDLQKSVEATFGQLPPSTAPIQKPRGYKQNVANKNSKEFLFPSEHAQYDGTPAFSREQLGKLVQIKPISETRKIKLYFATPPNQDPMLKECWPQRTLSHLLGHESPGSLHALLNAKGWITGLSSGNAVESTDFSLFGLTLDLTPSGMANKEEVLDLVFEWISLIREEVECADDDHRKMASYHDELRQISRMNFRFRENGDPTDFCSTAAELMFTREPTELLMAGAAMAKPYRQDVALAFWDRIRPRNCLVQVFDSDLKIDPATWKQEKWYKADYTVRDLSQAEMQRWNAPTSTNDHLHLPALNQYIPTDFSLRCDDSENKVDVGETGGTDLDDQDPPPTVLVETDSLRFWHKMDRKWRVPKTFLRLSLLTPAVYRTPRSITLNRIYERILNDDLASFVYDASLAGCNYRVACVPTGYRISVRGYSEKLPSLLDTLYTRMLSLIDELKSPDSQNTELAAKFAKAKQNLLRETKNYAYDPPYERASYNSRLMLEETVWTVKDYMREMEENSSVTEKAPLTMAQCAAAAKDSLTGRVKAEALCMGNIDEQGAHRVREAIESHFVSHEPSLLYTEAPKFRAMKLPTRAEAASIFGDEVAKRKIPLIQQDIVTSAAEENNAVEVILQCGNEHSLGYEGVALLQLIMNMGYNSAYNMLRTKEQLGYIVHAVSRKNSGGGWSLSISVQSSVATPSKLEERVEAWVETFRQELEDMDPKALAAEATAVAAQLLERDTKLAQEVGNRWTEILATEGKAPSLRTPSFGRLERLAEELMVSLDDNDTSEGKVNCECQKKTASQLKTSMLQLFDEHFPSDAPERRSMVSRVYSHRDRAEYEAHVGAPGVLSNYEEVADLKQYLSTQPLARYRQ